MAKRRSLHGSISISEQVDQLSIPAALLFTWAISHLDDFGRITGSPARFGAQVVPLKFNRKGWTVSDIDGYLDEMSRAQDEAGTPLVVRYQVNGIRAAWFPKFEEHQDGLHKRTKSKWPDPPRDGLKFPEVPGTSRKFPEVPSEVIDPNSVHSFETKRNEVYIVPFAEVVDDLNRQTGKNYRVCDSTKRLIQARWNNGYRLEHFKKVIDLKAQEWRGTNMDKYLRPETLFKEKKFEAYLNQAPKPKVNTVPDAEEIIRRNEEDGFID